MQKDEIREFEKKKKLVQDYQLKLSELKGELKSAEQTAMQKFKTKNVEELKDIKKKLSTKVENLELKIEKLSAELDEKIEAIEIWGEEKDD